MRTRAGGWPWSWFLEWPHHVATRQILPVPCHVLGGLRPERVSQNYNFCVLAVGYSLYTNLVVIYVVQNIISYKSVNSKNIHYPNTWEHSSSTTTPKPWGNTSLHPSTPFHCPSLDTFPISIPCSSLFPSLFFNLSLLSSLPPTFSLHHSSPLKEAYEDDFQ